MMNITEPLLGGMMIGAGSLLALMSSGKVPGISGVVAKILRPRRGDLSWRVIFLLSLIISASLTMFFFPDLRAFSIPKGRGLTTLCIAGFLVGFGARVGGGCTSGHGVCGIGAGAKDALLYTCVFMGTGALTVFLWNAIKGGLFT